MGWTAGVFKWASSQKSILDFGSEIEWCELNNGCPNICGNVYFCVSSQVRRPDIGGIEAVGDSTSKQ